MEPKDVLAKALAAVEEAGVPEDLRELAFAKALDLYAGTTSFPARGGQQRETPLPPKPNGGPGTAEGLAKVAQSLNVPQEEIENYFSEDSEGELTFVGDPRPLGKDTSSQARAVSLLLGYARQVGGYDSQGTPRKILRAACDSLGIVDSNYSKLFDKKKEWFTTSGSGQNVTVKVKPAGRTAAEEMMGELRSR